MMLLIAPHNMHTLEQDITWSRQSDQNVAFWWVLQLFVGKEEKTSWWWSRSEKLWNFVYVSMERLVIVSAWSDLILFLHSWGDGGNADSKEFSPPKWLIHREEIRLLVVMNASQTPSHALVRIDDLTPHLMKSAVRFVTNDASTACTSAWEATNYQTNKHTIGNRDKCKPSKWSNQSISSAQLTNANLKSFPEKSSSRVEGTRVMVIIMSYISKSRD